MDDSNGEIPFSSERYSLESRGSFSQASRAPKILPLPNSLLKSRFMNARVANSESMRHKNPRDRLPSASYPYRVRLHSLN
jgi:hypothetical protein